MTGHSWLNHPGAPLQTFFFTIVAIASIMFAMSLGVILTGRRLKGSCGGVGSDCECEIQGLSRAKDCPLKKIAVEQSV